MTMVASQVNIERALSIPGWMTKQELTWLATMAKECKIIVEFGSFHGRSCMALADNICDGGIIWAVDPWAGNYQTEEGFILADVNTYVMPEFCRNLKDHISSGKVIPYRGFSYNFNLDQYADMVFIDGDHRYKTIVKDVRKAIGLVKPGGIISGHDYNHTIWPGVKAAVDELLKGVQVEGTIWWTRKS